MTDVKRGGVPVAGVLGGASRDPRFDVENEQVRATLNSIAKKIGGALDKGWGFTLLLFEFGPDGSLFYISSAEREDVIRMVKEWVAKQDTTAGQGSDHVEGS